jgi:ribosome maturation protein Sdo1
MDYYKAPSQEIFEDIKKNAIKIWQTYDNTYGYVDEKVGRIEGMENISDNAWTIVVMFDSDNQAKLFEAVKPATRKILTELLKENGYL